MGSKLKLLFSCVLMSLIVLIGTTDKIKAQESPLFIIDSLKSLINSTPDDSSKLKLFIAIGNTCHDNSIMPDTGLKYSFLALKLATQLHLQRGIAIANLSIGGNYYVLENGQKSLEYVTEALKICQALNDESEIGNCWADLGTTYNLLKQYDKALYYSRLAMDYFKSKRNFKLRAISESAIAFSFIMMNENDSAIFYCNDIVALAKERGTKTEEIAAYNNMGETYKQLAKYRESLQFYHKAFSAIDAKNEAFAHIVLGNIGEVYLLLAKNSKSFPNNDTLIPNNKSACLKKSLNYLRKGVSGAIGQNNLSGAIEYCGYISEACKQSGDYKEAFNYYREYAELLDSMVRKGYRITVENMEEIHAKEIEIKNNVLKMKEAEIAINQLEIESKRKRTYLLALSTLFLTIVFIISYRNNRHQKKLNHLLTTEKQKADKLLLNILPEPVAEELKANGHTTAKLYPQATVMFTDFKGFTQFSEIRTPDEIIYELNECFHKFDEIMMKYGIEKIKTIGDSYMAVAGLHGKPGDEAHKMILAAKEILHFIEERHGVLGDRVMEIRIGIHTGCVIAGVVGIMKFAYDVWGDAVNIASRIEQGCDAGKINISEATFQLVNTEFKCSYRGEIEAKNKGLLKMYYIE